MWLRLSSTSTPQQSVSLSTSLIRGAQPSSNHELASAISSRLTANDLDAKSVSFKLSPIAFCFTTSSALITSKHQMYVNYKQSTWGSNQIHFCTEFWASHASSCLQYHETIKVVLSKNCSKYTLCIARNWNGPPAGNNSTASCPMPKWMLTDLFIWRICRHEFNGQQTRAKWFEWIWQTLIVPLNMVWVPVYTSK